jgi:predicted MFS family arabinose efflux permease
LLWTLAFNRAARESRRLLQLSPSRVVFALCISQVISWGSLYYSFPAVATALDAEGRWSTPGVSGAFSLSLLIAALCGPLVARVIERYGGRIAMSGGSALAALALGTLASADHIAVFYLGWILAGVATAFSLYEAAFSVLAFHHSGSFRRSVGIVTIAGGFASTVFWPLSTALSQWLGWRAALLCFAALHAFVCLPLHWLGLPRHEPSTSLPETRASGRIASAARPRLLLLAGSFSLSALVTSIAAVHLIPRLIERGDSIAWAVSLAALAGPFQVLARLTEFAPRVPSISLSGATALSCLALSMWTLAAGKGAALVAAVAAYGMANGMLTIVRSASLMDVVGPSGYARASGMTQSPALVARAAGPFLAATVLSEGVTYEDLFGLLGASAVASLVLFMASSFHQKS